MSTNAPTWATTMVNGVRVGRGSQHLYQCITTCCLQADESDSGGRPGMEGAAAAAANEDCRQGRAGGRQSQQSAFHQQPAEAHNLGMWCPSLQQDRSSTYLLAGQSAELPGQRSSQQPSPTARHYTQRYAGSRQYQQIADAMRRNHALQAQTRHAPPEVSNQWHQWGIIQDQQSTCAAACTLIRCSSLPLWFPHGQIVPHAGAFGLSLQQ